MSLVSKILFGSTVVGVACWAAYQLLFKEEEFENEGEKYMPLERIFLVGNKEDVRRATKIREKFRDRCFLIAIKDQDRKFRLDFFNDVFRREVDAMWWIENEQALMSAGDDLLHLLLGILNLPREERWENTPEIMRDWLAPYLGVGPVPQGNSS